MAMHQYVLRAGDAAKSSVLILNLSSGCFVRCANCISAKTQQAVGLRVWARHSWWETNLEQVLPTWMCMGLCWLPSTDNPSFLAPFARLQSLLPSKRSAESVAKKKALVLGSWGFLPVPKMCSFVSQIYFYIESVAQYLYMRLPKKPPWIPFGFVAEAKRHTLESCFCSYFIRFVWFW